jgi:uncharacterized protein (DUF433 family)
MSTSSLAATENGAPSLAEMIVKTPGTCGGKARIAGTRIKVKHIYVWVEQQGMTPAQVVAEYPHLTMAQVHAALAYYWSHESEIKNEIEEEDKFVAELQAKAAPSKLAERLKHSSGPDDTLSPR